MVHPAHLRPLHPQHMYGYVRRPPAPSLCLVCPAAPVVWAQAALFLLLAAVPAAVAQSSAHSLQLCAELGVGLDGLTHRVPRNSTASLTASLTTCHKTTSPQAHSKPHSRPEKLRAAQVPHKEDLKARPRQGRPARRAASSRHRDGQPPCPERPPRSCCDQRR